MNSFQESILPFYPIIAPQDLQELMTGFLQREHAGHFQSGSSCFDRKRKRPPVEDEEDTANAVILLVLALGRFCLDQKKIPEFLDLDGSTHPVRPIKTSAWLQLPTLTGRSEPPSPPSTMGSPPLSSHPLERAFVPGFAMFARAKAIISAQFSDCSREHIQMDILAALYGGLVGKSQEAWGHICSATRAIHTWQASVEDNPFRLLFFWTCVEMQR